MRILFFTEAFWPHIGGVEVNLASLVEPLAELGHEVMVVGDLRDGEDLPAIDSYRGAAVRRVEISGPLLSKDLERVMAARALIAELRDGFAPDLIHTTYTYGTTSFVLASVLRGSVIPSVVTIPGLIEMSRSTRALLDHILDGAAAVVTPSRALGHEVAAIWPHVADLLRPILNGVTDPEKAPVPPPQEPTVVVAGRLSPEKGYDVALHAFAALAVSRSDARMLLAGDGPERARLEALVAELAIGERVEFLGWISPAEIWGVIDRSSVVVVPSLCSEGFGLIAAEAALRERPVVASRVGGLPEVVDDGRTGLLVPPEDPVPLAAALIELINHSERRRRMGAAAAVRARELFSIERQAAELDALYRELVSAPAARAAEPARATATRAPGR